MTPSETFLNLVLGPVPAQDVTRPGILIDGTIN